MKQTNFIFRHLKFIALVYLLGMLCFFVFRVLLFVNNYDKIETFPIETRSWLILRAFFMGFRFDTVISGYLLFLPLILSSVFCLANYTNKITNKLLFTYLFTLYSFAFLICAIDIPYFSHFFSRMNVAAFLWADSPVFVFNMVVQEFRFWGYLIPFILLNVLFFIFLKKIIKKNLLHSTHKKAKKLKPLYITPNIIITLFFALLLFVGIRGRTTQKSPIRVGTAYFSNYAFANKLGLNPVFTFLRSWLDAQKEENEEVYLIDDTLALNNVKKYLDIKESKYSSPIAREIIPDSTKSKKFNIVIVIMEGISAGRMARYNNTQNYTPFLDSLSKVGYTFDNIYTAGLHTFNGIYSTITSFPAVLKKHTMNTTNIPQYNNIANSLKKHGYSTTYFTTHDDQFDNVGGFLSANNFEQIIDQKDYPSDEIKTAMGVSDDFMFAFSIPILNKLSKKKKPFLSIFMTGSNHSPYYIPEYYKPRHQKIGEQALAFSDWSMEQFIERSAKEEWFDSTLFVFVADHGCIISPTYDIGLNYLHIPLIFYAPKLLSNPTTFDCIGGQIDVYPTIMGLLNLPYVNNTLGIDLLKEKRPYIYINADTKYGVLDNEHYLIVRDNNLSFYKYRTKDTRNYINEYKKKADSMKTYAISNMQVTQWLINNQKTFVEE